MSAVMTVQDGLVRSAEAYLAALVSRDPSVVARFTPVFIGHHPVDGVVTGVAGSTARFAAGPSWLGDVATVEPIASTVTGLRVITEAIVHARVGGRDVDLPTAAAVTFDASGAIAMVRLYRSTRLVAPGTPARGPLRQTLRDLELSPAASALQAAVESGDAKRAAAVFADDGVLIDADGVRHQGSGAILQHFGAVLRNGGPILHRCTLTTEGATAAVEFTQVRHTGAGLVTTPGLAVHVDNGDGKLSQVRYYESDGRDVTQPADTGR